MGVHLVFRAKGPTARLTLSDWPAPTRRNGAPLGQELIFNFIEVEPFLMD